MIIIRNDAREVAKLQVKLSIRFEMKDLGEHHFLGLEVENVKNDILISQKGYEKKYMYRKKVRGASSHLMLICRLGVKKGVFLDP